MATRPTKALGERKRVLLEKKQAREVGSKRINNKSTSENSNIDELSGVKMARQHLRIASLFQELALLVENEPKLSGDVRANFNDVQRQVLTALAGDVIESPHLPSTAPEVWADRKNKAENPVEFIRRVYAEFLGKGLSRPDIRKLDWKLYRSLYKWKETAGDFPADFERLLPTRSQVTETILAKAGAQEGQVPPDIRRAMKIYNAVGRRRRSKAP